MTARPVAIDLFAGVGGLSLGLEQAGFDVKAAVEIDPIHAAAHKYNFPECAVVAKSVVGLSAREIRAACGLASDQKISLVAGGPPCQGFSMIGHRSLEDTRNRLVHEFVRLVADLEADYFIFENVKGLTVGKHKDFLDELVTAFANRGYSVRLPWKVLNAANFGVPQNRERLILFGAKVGLELPTYPIVRTRPAGSAYDSGLPSGPSVKDAISDLPNADEFPEWIETDKVHTSKFGLPSFYALEMRCEAPSAWYYGYRRLWNPELLTSSWRTDHTEISRKRFSRTQPGKVEPISRFFRLSGVGLSNTLRAGTDGARGAFTSPRPIHFEYERCITVREMARLHGFPDWFRMHWTKWHGARQIGNAVPPPLARALAEQVIVAIGTQPIVPDRVLALGDESLLYLRMAKAAEGFGVDVLPQRRDKRSGARKRSQVEIEEMLQAAE